MPTLKDQAMALRLRGFTRPEIEKRLDVLIAKGTFAYWTRELILPAPAQRRLEKIRLAKLKLARAAASKQKRTVSEGKRDLARKQNFHLKNLLAQHKGAKLALAILYLGEGTKYHKRAALTLGNANLEVIRLYLKLLRTVYNADPAKLRCTVQCRADQNIPELQKFWQKLTTIPPKQFYKTQIDPRSIGKVTTRKDYKGVCRIDYLSAQAFTDLMETIKLLLE